MTTRANKRLRRAFVVLVVIGIVLNAALLFAFIQVRADFCGLADQVVAGAHQLPQVPGRVDAEQAYGQLETKLGCH